MVTSHTEVNIENCSLKIGKYYLRSKIEVNIH